MKSIKLLILFVFTFISSLVFAAKDTTMTINFINVGPVTGYVGIENNGNMSMGPILEKNGGRITLTPTVNNVIYPAFIYVSGGAVMCQNQDGYLDLDPTKYDGSPIFITMTVDQNYNVQCTCTGSACSYGSSLKK